jgi:hypothetical protein
MHAHFKFVLALSLIAGTALAQSHAATPPSAIAAANVLTEGTPIQLAVGRMVSSQTDQAGEVVEFVVKKELVVDGQVVLPLGSSVYGKIIASQLEDRSAGKPGSLEFRLDSLKLSNGQLIPLRTIKEIPSDPGADIKPEKLINLVNSPYAPFAHFNNGTTTTVPKDSKLTLFVGADVVIGAPVVAKPLVQEQAEDSVASHVVNGGSAKSLGEIAREQRERGKIAGGMVTTPQ